MKAETILFQTTFLDRGEYHATYIHDNKTFIPIILAAQIFH